MATKSPIFPMPEPQHFSDYGFDPQIDYFQKVLEEARKHKRETASSSIDSLHFKLQKPISKDESKRIKKSKRRWWWSKALLFLRRRWTGTDGDRHGDGIGVHRGRAYRGSISGPMYITECTSGSSTPYRTTSRPTSGPLAGTLPPTRKREVEIPYISLRELNMEAHHRISTPAIPISLVS